MRQSRVVVAMPHMGVSVEEGTVIAWRTVAGDRVVAGEPLCDIATDKVDAEVVAPADGVVARLLAAEGDVVAVGAPLAELAAEGDVPPPDDSGLAAGPEATSEDRPAPTVAPAADGDAAPGPATVATTRFDPAAASRAVVAGRPGHGRPLASPVARRLAAEHGIDLRTVDGTGLRGRIRKSDVLARVDGRERPPRDAPEPPASLPRGYHDVPHEVVATSHQRRAIAEHMVRSRHTAAHMTTEVEVDMLPASRARDAINTRREAAGRPRVSYLALIARASCTALQRFPDLNATFDERRLIRWREVNLAVAVDTDAGLLAPVIRGCERLTAEAIADALGDLARRARAGRLTPDDMRAGTFTISNPGSVGAVSAMAIINQPQVAILGTPAIVRRPVVARDEAGQEVVAIRPVMTLALTFDHRAVDGAHATRCAVLVKELLEGWDAVSYA